MVVDGESPGTIRIFPTLVMERSSLFVALFCMRFEVRTLYEVAAKTQ